MGVHGLLESFMTMSTYLTLGGIPLYLRSKGYNVHCIRSRRGLYGGYYGANASRFETTLTTQGHSCMGSKRLKMPTVDHVTSVGFLDWPQPTWTCYKKCEIL